MGIWSFICKIHLRHSTNSQRTGKKDFRIPRNWKTPILYTSCFDANGGLFETILNENDAVISDELNHASIIDGCSFM